MNIVVTSNSKVDYSGGFLRVSTLREACDIVGTIDVLVYNSSEEESSDKIEYMGKLKDRVKKLIYICYDENVDNAIKMMVIGSGGKYLDDEFFLESSDELSNLVDSLEEITEIASLGGTNVISDFLNRYLNGKGNDFNQNYLMVVRNAVNELITSYNQKNMEIIQMSETATEVFSKTTSIVSKMRKERENLQDIIEKTSNSLANQSSPIVRGGSSISYFPRVNYLKDRTIIRIKEIGSFAFLTSFSLGLRSYAENRRNLRTKIIFIMPIGDVLSYRYSKFNWITKDNYKSGDYSGDVVFTNCPNREVMFNLLGDTLYSLFIVVDRTFYDKEHILNCKGSSVKYAVSGESAVDELKLNKVNCFSQIIEYKGMMFSVPLFKSYPKGEIKRANMYHDGVADCYNKLLSDIKGV